VNKFVLRWGIFVALSNAYLNHHNFRCRKLCLGAPRLSNATARYVIYLEIAAVLPKWAQEEGRESRGTVSLELIKAARFH